MGGSIISILVVFIMCGLCDVSTYCPFPSAPNEQDFFKKKNKNNNKTFIRLKSVSLLDQSLSSLINQFL